MKTLIFFHRQKKTDEFSIERTRATFSNLTHYERVGMVLSPKMLDTRGIRMFAIYSFMLAKKRLSKPLVGNRVIVYYIEQGVENGQQGDK